MLSLNNEWNYIQKERDENNLKKFKMSNVNDVATSKDATKNIDK